MIKIFKHLLYVFILFSNYLFAQNEQMFANPILAGFYPDPSICKVDDNYYLVTSTFSYFPGLPVFQSKDMVNWKLIGYVLDRSEQLNLDGLGVSRGLFAPAIRYNNGIFYVTCTLVDIGGNFVVTSKSPEGPWTNPVWLPEIDGIDPSLFFDEDGKSYIIYNSVPPNNQQLYEGHRTLRMYEFDSQNLKVVGEEHLIVNGGTDLSKKPIWIEAPHIFYVKGYYYLIAAEGGTADQHSEVVFRSENIFGPYVPYENNPILTQRHLDPARNNPITSTGHADFVQTDNGDWWAVFLGCRPYSLKEDGFYNTGRETFLAPVKWIEDSKGIEWPIINPDYEEVQYAYQYPLPSKPEIINRAYGGNFTLRDNFNKEDLDNNWFFLRTPYEKWYDLKSKEGVLSLQLRPETCSGNKNPSFLAHRQQHLKCAASTAIKFKPKADNEKAGLLIFQNENHFYFLCKSFEDNEPVVQLFKSVNANDPIDQLQLIASEKIDNEESDGLLHLQINADKNVYSFYYAFLGENGNRGKWNLLKDKIDASFLSTKIAGGFVGCVFALYATSMGEASNSTASFDYFEYTGDDEVYKTGKNNK